ncbi:MAG: hypothetical protein K8S55_10770 [Phycisphaerae bacterium]|nr:hypothetical protein [Phycisphaerae bacterium]
MTPTVSDAILSGNRQVTDATPDVAEAELSMGAQSEENRDAWDRFIDDTLVEWGRNISILEDENFEPPSAEIINLACTVALDLRDAGGTPPTRIVPDGDGGISFERVDGTSFVSLDIYSDQSIEFLEFDDCRLVSREIL